MSRRTSRRITRKLSSEASPLALSTAHQALQPNDLRSWKNPSRETRVVPLRLHQLRLGKANPVDVVRRLNPLLSVTSEFLDVLNRRQRSAQCCGKESPSYQDSVEFLHHDASGTRFVQSQKPVLPSVSRFPELAQVVHH